MTPLLRSTADAQRVRVLASALGAFARTGYHATPVSEVAAGAGISTAYVFRLFPGKLALFTAAIDHCYEQVARALAVGADGAGEDAAHRLAAMADAYADLIADRRLLMF